VSALVKVLGVLTDPGSPPVVTVHPPTQGEILPPVERDDVGTYHADGVFPTTAEDGIWVARVTTSGTGTTTLKEERFLVKPLAFPPPSP
jgi:hypothetical protein